MAGRKTDQQRMIPLQAMNSHQKWAYQRYYANTSQIMLDPKQNQALLEHKQKEAEDAVKLHLTEALKETMQRQQSTPIGSQEPLLIKSPPPLMLKSTSPQQKPQETSIPPSTSPPPRAPI